MVASMWIGNAMLVIINLPLVGVWVRLLKVPYRILFPAILMFCCIGVYSINSSAVDVLLVALFGGVGYFLLKHGFEPAPLLLAFVLGPLMEENLRRSFLIARGDPMVFVTRPLSAALLVVAVILLALVLLPSVRKRREEVFHEEE
jgi:putative tricarboxylic transport membrane protein